MTLDLKTACYSKTHKAISNYMKTHEAPYRYLCYRDMPQIIQKYVVGKKALDYGAGPGYSTQFLHQLGFEVMAVDTNKDMIHQAQSQYPHCLFHHIINGMLPFEKVVFDLVFSSFVLFEISSHAEIIHYLKEAKRVMKKSGCLIAITGSEELHNPNKTWLDFDNKFPENENLKSGNLVKGYQYDSQIKFTDYYWTRADYEYCFENAGFSIAELYQPLGHRTDPHPWIDEFVFPMFNILIARPEQIKQSSVNEINR